MAAIVSLPEAAVNPPYVVESHCFPLAFSFAMVMSPAFVSRVISLWLADLESKGARLFAHHQSREADYKESAVESK